MESLQDLKLSLLDSKTIDPPPENPRNTFRSIGELDKVISEMLRCDIPSAKYGSHSTSIYCLCLSPIEKLLYSGSNNSILKIWNIETKEEAQAIEIFSSPKCFCITKDEKHLIIGGFDCTIKFFHTKFMKFDFILQGHKNTVNCMVLSKDQKYLISGSEDCTVIVWEINQRKVHIVLEGHLRPVLCICISQSNQYCITGGEDKVIRVWSTSKYKMDFTVTCASTIISLVAYSKVVVSGLEDGKIIVWNLVEKREEFRLLSHSLYISTLCMGSNKEVMISSSGDNTMKFWDLKERRCEFSLKSKDIIKRLVVSDDLKKIYTGNSKGDIHEWEIEENNAHQFKYHEDVSYSLIVTKSDRYVITSSDKVYINIWDFKSRGLLFRLKGHEQLVYALDCSADETLLVSGGADKVIKLWDLRTQSWKSDLIGHKEQVLSVKLSSNNQFLVSGSRDCSIRYWDLSKNTQLFVLNGHSDFVHSVCFIKNEKFLASGSFDCTIKVWSIENQAIERTLTGHSQYVIQIIPFHGSLISVSGDKTIRIWDLTDFKEESILKGHSEAIWSISASPNGQEIATSSIDSTIKVWNIEERCEKYTLKGHIGCVTCCAFSNDGKYILSTSFDETLLKWNVHPHSDFLNPFPYQSKKTFMSMLTYFRDYLPPLASHTNLLISRYKYTLLHIYSNLGKHELLKSALESNPNFSEDALGHSPLYYAIKKRSFHCIDMLLTYLIALKKKAKDKIPIYVNAIKDEFEMILKTSSDLLPKFVDLLMVTKEKTFGLPKNELPWVISTENRKASTLYFLLSESFDQEKHISLKIQSSIIPFSMKSGSSSSLRFLTRILNCNQIQIFRTQLIRGLIKVKWRNLRVFIMIFTLLLWSNIGIMIYLVLFDRQSFEVLIMYLSVNSLLLLVEIIKMFRLKPKEYTTNVWNIVDVLRMISCVCWYYYGEYRIVTWAMILLNFIRGIAGFRAFHFTRFYTRLIIRAFSDIISFFFLFAYSIFAFGVLLNFEGNEKTITEMWMFSYELSLGQYQIPSDDLLQYFSFILATIFNIIIMLSLLISILGDSFDKFQMESIDIDYKEMAEELKNVEILLFCRRRALNKSYIHICNTKNNADDAKDWEGKIRAIEKNNSYAIFDIKKSTDLLTQKVSAIEQNNEKSLKDLERKIEVNHYTVERIERKLEDVLKELKKATKKSKK